MDRIVPARPHKFETGKGGIQEKLSKVKLGKFEIEQEGNFEEIFEYVRGDSDGTCRSIIYKKNISLCTAAY